MGEATPPPEYEEKGEKEKEEEEDLGPAEVDGRRIVLRNLNLQARKGKKIVKNSYQFYKIRFLCQIPKGSLVAVVGRVGSGKSTLVIYL